MGKATQDLIKEHEAILFVLKILDKMIDTNAAVDNTGYCEELVYFLKVFADQCHHGKEENILFKALESSGIPNEGGPIGVMLSEHAEGRGHISAMGKALEVNDAEAFNSAAAQYRDLLRVHINKENMILFKMADQVLDDEKQAELFERFEEHEEHVIGHGVHEKLHAMIDTWAGVFGVSEE